MLSAWRNSDHLACVEQLVRRGVIAYRTTTEVRQRGLDDVIEDFVGMPPYMGALVTDWTDDKALDGVCSGS